LKQRGGAEGEQRNFDDADALRGPLEGVVDAVAGVVAVWPEEMRDGGAQTAVFVVVIVAMPVAMIVLVAKRVVLVVTLIGTMVVIGAVFVHRRMVVITTMVVVVPRHVIVRKLMRMIVLARSVRMVVLVTLRVRMRMGCCHGLCRLTIDLNCQCSQWCFRMSDMQAAHELPLLPLPVAYLQLFVATARTGNLTRAANEVAITQSTATRWLQAVERVAGGKLLERTTGGVRLTTLGATFLPFAERSVRAVEDGFAQVRDVRAGRAGTLRLGCSEVTSTYFLPRVLLRFRQEYPTIDLRVRTGPVLEIADAVLEGELEIAFVPSADDARFETILLEADEHVFVVAANDPFAHQAQTRLADLGARGLILFGIGEPTAPYGMEPFLAAHLTPRITMEVDSVETAKRMVLEGFGAALLPRMAVGDELASGRLAVVELVGVDLGHWHVRMVRRRERQSPGPQSTFWTWCAESLPAGHPHG
jgi:DNA-binding transcriptional LysR family regulator